MLTGRAPACLRHPHDTRAFRARVAQIELRAEDGKAYQHFRWVKKPGAILAQVDQWIGARFSIATRGDH